MANSKVQSKCENWITKNWLPEKYSMVFYKQKIRMQNRGYFEFDAVSSDGKIIANISTASVETHKGTRGSGKVSKLRADCLMLSLIDVKQKLMLLTERSLFDFALSEQQEGRLPIDIQILKIDLPKDLKAELATAKNIASKEVRGH